MPKNPRSYEKTRHIALSGLLFALAMALSFIEGSLVIPGPVSYTHLDVYKRQLRSSRAPSSLRMMQTSPTITRSTNSPVHLSLIHI